MDFSTSRTRVISNLDAFGYKRKGDGDFIVVKLPLFSSIRIIFSQESVSLEPRFGNVGRTSSSWTFMLAAVAVASLVSWIEMKSGPVLMYIVLAGAVWDVYRYILTESMITRIQNWLEPA